MYNDSTNGGSLISALFFMVATAHCQQESTVQEESIVMIQGEGFSHSSPCYGGIHLKLYNDKNHTISDIIFHVEKVDIVTDESGKTNKLNCICHEDCYQGELPSSL